MRVLLVNWARIWEGAGSGGGVSGYCHALSMELLHRGHDVSYVFSGHTYVPKPFSRKPGECRVRRIPDFESLRVFEIVNSPVVAPSFYQFHDPLGEASSPALERELAHLLDVLKPEIVHFHNLEGFSAGCVNVASARTATVFSLHNYHTLCPQVNLMFRNRMVCTDYRNGHNCTTCVNAPKSEDEKQQRAAAYRRGLESVHPLLNGNGGFASWLNRGSIAEAISLFSDPPGPPFPGRPFSAPADLTLEGRTRPKSDRLSDEKPVTPDDLAYAPISNEPTADPRHDLPPNGFSRRRQAMLAALSRCDRVHAVSQFVARKFEVMGVPRERLEAIHIGSRMATIAANQQAFLADPPAFDTANPRPIRLLFMGYHNFFKGLHMLADVLETLPTAVSSRFHLSVFALQSETIEPRFRAMRPKLAGLAFNHGYRYEEVPRLAAGHDLGVVPSVWWDNGPQTVMEFFACGLPVLGAALGGIPDFVRHGVDGLLFRGNDREALSKILTDIAANPSVLFNLRRNVRPPKDMVVHTTEMESLYTRCMKGRAATNAPVAAP